MHMIWHDYECIEFDILLMHWYCIPTVPTYLTDRTKYDCCILDRAEDITPFMRTNCHKK
ncbi:MAG: hypothetical protein RLZZ297_651 [Chloroflexota bacterium]